VFFACRTTSGERYWRFVETGGDVITEDAEMLRRINPGPAPGIELEQGVIDLELAWARAVESILAEHNLRADPRTQTEGIGPIQRFALEILRDPSVPLSPGAADAEAALTVERGPAVRRALGSIRTEVQEGTISREEAARRIIEVVESFGLREVEPPPLLEQITEDDVGVVCWMVVLSG
jgi:hypothetical protein